MQGHGVPCQMRRKEKGERRKKVGTWRAMSAEKEENERIMKHKLEVQIRFNDIDILGHLNNTVYYSLYDLGKARYMEDIGLRPRGPVAPTCVIADVHCTYFFPIHYGDEIYVTTECREVGEKHFTLEQELVDGEGQVRSHCTTVMVYIDPATGKSAPLPENYKQALER